MIGATWNVRGLNKRGRLQCITDFVHDNNLDFVSLQETKKESFDEPFLRSIHRNFTWHCLPATGTAGGILVGFDESKMEVTAWQTKTFCLSAMVKNHKDHLHWRYIAVYGSPYEEGKLDFIQELHSLVENWDGPTVIGGDFNLVTNAKEKNNGSINFKWSALFQDWINKQGLIELKNPTRSFTWTNNQEQPIMAAIDKIFCNTSFGQCFPLAHVAAKPRAGSDHVPLVLNFGINAVRKPATFRFEKWWLHQPGFGDLVKKVWDTPCAFSNPMDIWQFKVRLLRKKVKGWAININAEIKKLKKDLLKEFDLLDLKQDAGSLLPEERSRMKNISEDLDRIWCMEEMKARQRSRDRIIREGDRNTAYFQAVANQRDRKKRIQCLESADGLREENEDMLNHAVDFYKNLFAQEQNLGVHLDSNFWGEEDKVTSTENELLEAPFTEEEIKEAVFGSYAEWALGPDGFSFLFYQHFWDVIKVDLMNLVREFEKGDLNLDRLNYAVIMLIPKEAEAKTFKKFRPISLINCSFKIL